MEAWRIGSQSAGPKIKRNYLRGTDYLIACSRSFARSLTTCYANILGRVSTIYYGVALNRFKPSLAASLEIKAFQQEFGLSEGDPVVGFIGRLAPQKGLSYLLAAAEILQKRYANLCFVVVGDGPIGAELKAATALLGQTRFLFLGERYDA